MHSNSQSAGRAYLDPMYEKLPLARIEQSTQLLIAAVWALVPVEIERTILVASVFRVV